LRNFSLSRSLAVGLIVAFSVFGVILYAFGEEETLAGPTTAFVEDMDSKPALGRSDHASPLRRDFWLIICVILEVPS
jgi:hypothetical protein